MPIYVITASKPPVGTAVGPSINVWHYQTVSPVTADIQKGPDTLKLFYDALTSIIAGGSDYQIGSGMKRVDVTPPEFQSPTVKTSHPLGVTPLLPAQCCLTVSWRTISAGRSYRGRTFLGPLTSAALDGSGNPTAATFTALGNAVNVIVNFNNTDPNGSKFGVYSTVHDGAPRATPIFTPYTSGSAGAKVFTQRRRSS